MANQPNPEHDGRADFDFLVGRWKIHHRRLRERLKGSTSWEEFEGASICCHILGGLGNIDEISADREAGHLEGFTVRLFDPVSCEWSIYWASNVVPGKLDIPMIGRFINGRGEFYAHETHESQHVYTRFIWSSDTPTTARWEQALSADGGRTWETNWIMEFTREE